MQNGKPGVGRLRLSCHFRGLRDWANDHGFHGLPFRWFETSRRKNRTVHAHRTVGITDFRHLKCQFWSLGQRVAAYRLQLLAFREVVTAQ